MVVGPVNDRTTQAFLTVVEDNGLARRDGTGRIIEFHRDLLTVLGDVGSHADILLTVTELGCAVEVATVAAETSSTQ